jgi:HAMP domain-containing protein
VTPAARPMSIRAKLVVAIVASMVALAVFTAALVRAVAERNVRIAAEQAVSAAGQALASAERADVEKLDATLRVLALHPGLTDAFAARDRARLLATAAPVFDALRAEHDVTHVYFIEPEPARTCFLRVHHPGWFGDVIERATLSKAIETKRVAAGKELGRTAFALRVVRPWHGPDGKLLGYLELGEQMDHFLDRMKAQTGDDYGLLVDKAFLDEAAWAGTRGTSRNDWAERNRTVLVDTTAAEEVTAGFDDDVASIPEAGVVLGEELRESRVFVRGIVPVKDAAGRRVGALFVRHDITLLHESMLAVRRSMYVALGAAAAALAALLLVLANRLVFRRLDRMIRSMHDLSARLAGGDYDVVAPRASGDDEIGRFEELFGRFLQVVAGLLKELSRNKTGTR